MPACAWLDARPAHSAAPSPQVVIGEQRGEGVRMGCRCFWDSDTDGYAEDTYRNVRTAHRASASRDPSTARAPPVACCVADRRTLCPQDSLFCVAAAFGSYLY